MVDTKHDFPIYRKYEGDFSFFKITTENQFIELKKMAGFVTKYEMNAKILPDFQFITDMIEKHNNHWIDSTAEEFNAVMALLKP